MHPVVEQVTESLRKRSQKCRQAYLDRCARTLDEHPPKKRLSCGNLAHGYAACSEDEKKLIGGMKAPNLGIISAYNDMLSAHQPLAEYPDVIKRAARELGGTAQMASGVPAMCDGVTQGQPGMDLSLFSRDVVAMATAVGLSHNLFDAVVCLGICDKIVPGMLIGALQFGHLPVGFIGSGPMASGISNKTKADVRQRFAQGRATSAQLLAIESASYHSPGTCTFYGTANSNQVLMEMLGLQLPGSSFLHPNDPLRPVLVNHTVKALMNFYRGSTPSPLCDVVTEASLVNAVVALLATGGSTNHTMHLVAIARSAGIELTWQDMDTLSRAVPLLARVYPNGSADINDFQDAGGMAFLVQELRAGGLLNEDVINLLGSGVEPYTRVPSLDSSGCVAWIVSAGESKRVDVLAPLDRPFSAEGGLRSLSGNLGESVIKVSAVAEDQRAIKAPCRIFSSQESLKQAFDDGELDRDVVVVVRFQGPAANGMPELHKMTPYLGVLQDKGFRVALVTDGRMSGASGKVPAAIHLTPEAIHDGPIALLQEGDILELDAERGYLGVHLAPEVLETRRAAIPPGPETSLGRNLFENFRRNVGPATLGGSVFDCVNDEISGDGAT
jgi:phosphogluconate dehydratase